MPGSCNYKMVVACTRTLVSGKIAVKDTTEAAPQMC
jgi:hypothetical protein